ncbi:MAG: hypothetical protein ACFFER_19445 [Candidatus Thorarchaeota archaeon]
MKKFGPLSIDLFVACKIAEMSKDGDGVSYSSLADELPPVVGKSTIPRLLTRLTEWGIVEVVYGLTESGRAGRFYQISEDAQALIDVTNDLCKSHFPDINPEEEDFDC